MPPVPPSPGVLADWCANRAWEDDIRDDDRRLLEMAANTIRALIVDRCRAVNRAEHLEAECETYVAMIYGPHGKGGE